MRWRFFLSVVITLAARAAPPSITICGHADNDLLTVLRDSRWTITRTDGVTDAINRAADNSAVLLLADEYPKRRIEVSADDWATAERKHLSLYVEFPKAIPGITLGQEKKAEWERAVITSEDFGTRLPRGRILSISDARYFACPGGEPLMVMARVAGYDSAVYGVPKNAVPILVDLTGRNCLVATTKLSGFITGRYAPTAEWGRVWRTILQRLLPKAQIPELHWTPSVAPALGKDEAAPDDLERATFDRAAHWFLHGRLLVNRSRLDEVKAAQRRDGLLTTPAIDTDGDGLHGILEGYSSAIQYDGSQLQRSAGRADCNAESVVVQFEIPAS